MKKIEPLGRYPYRCPDCPELQPYKSRVKYARHRAARHSLIYIDPPLYYPEPLALDLAAFKFEAGAGHGTGALPSLADHDAGDR